MPPAGSQPSDHASRTIGWKLDRAQRKELLQRFPPRYSNVVADHVTLRSGVSDEAPLPPDAEGAIVGRTDDDRGVEAMAVSIDGTTDRPDGGTYHITWSLESERNAKESNDVLTALGWVKYDEPIRVMLTPARWP